MPGKRWDQFVATQKSSRREFHAWVDHQVNRAEIELNGCLLNPLGRREGIDPRSLFYGPRVRAHKYASEELRDWWTGPGNNRMTFEAWDDALWY